MADLIPGYDLRSNKRSSLYPLPWINSSATTPQFSTLDQYSFGLNHGVIYEKNKRKKTKQLWSLERVIYHFYIKSNHPTYLQRPWRRVSVDEKRERWGRQQETLQHKTWAPVVLWCLALWGGVTDRKHGCLTSRTVLSKTKSISRFCLELALGVSNKDTNNILEEYQKKKALKWEYLKMTHI